MSTDGDDDDPWRTSGIPGEINAVGRTALRTNSSATTLIQRRLNFVNSRSVSTSAGSDEVDDEVDINFLVIGTSVNVPFTNGDTYQRVTITDSNATTLSRIVGTIRRPNTNEVDDKGYRYTADVIKRASGSFDVVFTCTVEGDPHDADLDPPDETIVYTYILA